MKKMVPDSIYLCFFDGLRAHTTQLWPLHDPRLFHSITFYFIEIFEIKLIVFVDEIFKQTAQLLDLIDGELWSDEDGIFAMGKQEEIEVFYHLQEFADIFGFTILGEVVRFVPFEFYSNGLLLSFYFEENAFIGYLFFHREKNIVLIESINNITDYK